MSQTFLNKLQATKEKAAEQGEAFGGGLYDKSELDSILSCKTGYSVGGSFGFDTDQPSDNFFDPSNSNGFAPSLDQPDVRKTDPGMSAAPQGMHSNLGPSLDQLKSDGTRKDTNKRRSEYSGTAWLSPYVAGFPPVSTQLQLVECHSIGSDGFSFFFPLSFQHDIIAVRFCGSDHFVDLCAKIIHQKSIQVPGKGTGCLIDCHFMGRLFLK